MPLLFVVLFGHAACQVSRSSPSPRIPPHLPLVTLSFRFLPHQNIAPKAYDGRSAVAENNAIVLETSITSNEPRNYRIVRVKNLDVTQNGSASDTIVDRSIFILIGNDLYWLNSVSSPMYTKFMATLSGRSANTGDNEIMEIEVNNIQFNSII